MAVDADAVVDEVEPPELADRRLRQPRRDALIADAAGDRDRPPALGTDGGRSRLRLGGVAGVDDNRRTLPRQPGGGGEADAARGPGKDRGLTLEPALTHAAES